MATKDDRALPVTPSPATPASAAPPPSGLPPVPARPPVTVIRIHGGVEEKLRRAWTSCDQFMIWLSSVIAIIEEMKAAQAGDKKDDTADRPVTNGKIRPRLPTVWIDSLWTNREPDGKVEAFVNGTRIVLKPHLGALFLALAEDTGVSDDEGVGFKSLEDLAVRQAKLTGGSVLPVESISKYIHRLRRELIDQAGLTSDVIQSRYRFGRRLAIKRSTLKRGSAARLEATGASSHSSVGSAET